jgi:hypothetical protein
VQPELAMARPSLRPLTPRWWPVVLRMRGLLKMGCLRTFAWDTGSEFVRPTFTLSQEPRMLFQNEHFNFLNLGAAKSQFISEMLDPLPCTGRWTWFARCLRISFQGSPLGARPLTKSLASSASDCALGSMIPRPPLDKGSVRESHLTLARVLEAFPPQMKFHTTPLIWLHILGLRFQQVARYHIEKSNTWLATRILPTRERLHLPRAMIFPFRVSMSLSKLASMGNRKPIWMPKYRTLWPSGIHLSPTSWPQSQPNFLTPFPAWTQLLVPIPSLGPRSKSSGQHHMNAHGNDIT